MKNKAILQSVCLMILFALLMACALPVEPTPVPTIPPATLAPTSAPSTALPPSETPTPTQTPTQIPTVPASPTKAAEGPAIVLQFAPGGTSAYADGSLAPGETRRYTVRAMKDQMLMTSVDSGGDVQMDVRALGSSSLLAGNVRAWHGRLPATQDYEITVKGSGSQIQYNLQVTVPVDIRFAPGGTSATLKGTIRERGINTYLAWAAAGQTMRVKITSPHEDVLLTVYGLEDGQPLVRYVSGASSWEGKLPGNQDYVIHAVSVGTGTDYQIEVGIK